MKKAIISVLSVVAGGVTGALAGATAVSNKLTESNVRIQKMSDKHFSLFLLMNQWVKVKQEGKNLASYFEANGYKKIAVYGMSYAGETLLNELKGSSIKVVYGIDKNADGIYSEIDIVSVDDDLENVDAVVVTAITFFDEIEKILASKVDCPIVSLEDILYEV